MRKITNLFFAVAALMVFNGLNAFAAAPVAAAPTPPVRPAANVSAIYSDAYAITATNVVYNAWWNASWSDLVVNTDNIKKILSTAGGGGGGIEFGGMTVRNMGKIHFDIYPTTAIVNAIKYNIVAVGGGGSDWTLLTGLVANQWNQVEIPVSSLNLGGKSVFQVGFGTFGAEGDFYIDNVYFYNNAAADSEAPTAFTASKGAITYGSVELLLNATDNSGAVTFEISYDGKTETTSSASAVSKSYIVSGLNGSTDYSFSVVAKDPTGNIAANSPIVIAATTTVAPPAAPIPNEPASDVISIFSDSYTNIAGVNINPSWNQATVVSTVSLSGNQTLKYANLNYQGTEFPSVNASTMNFLHVDVFTYDETSFEITAISPPNIEKLVKVTTLNLGQWNCYDIPLSDFTGVDKSAIFQLKVVGSGGKTVLLDNIYMFKTIATALTNVKALSSVQLFPNPASDKVTVVAASEISEIVISNILGQTVKVVSPNALEATIALDGVPAGQYIVSVKQVDGVVSAQNFVKK